MPKNRQRTGYSLQTPYHVWKSGRGFGQRSVYVTVRAQKAGPPGGVRRFWLAGGASSWKTWLRLNVWQVEDIVFATVHPGGVVQYRHVGETSDAKYRLWCSGVLHNLSWPLFALSLSLCRMFKWDRHGPAEQRVLTWRHTSLKQMTLIADIRLQNNRPRHKRQPNRL